MIDDELLVTPTVRLRLEEEGMFGKEEETLDWTQFALTGKLNSRMHLYGSNVRRDADGDYFAVVTRSNGLVHPFATDQFANDPPDDARRGFLQSLCWNLNRNLRHDGAWICAWTHPGLAVVQGDGTMSRQPTRFVLLWVDKDGDPQFTVENEEPFWRAGQASLDHWLEEAETGWTTWFHHMRTVPGVTSHETYKKAQGETPPSLRYGGEAPRSRSVSVGAGGGSSPRRPTGGRAVN